MSILPAPSVKNNVDTPHAPLEDIFPWSYTAPFSSFQRDTMHPSSCSNDSSCTVLGDSERHTQNICGLSSSSVGWLEEHQLVAVIALLNEMNHWLWRKQGLSFLNKQKIFTGSWRFLASHGDRSKADSFYRPALSAIELGHAEVSPTGRLLMGTAFLLWK